jgi:hypothetical protein
VKSANFLLTVLIAGVVLGSAPARADWLWNPFKSTKSERHVQSTASKSKKPSVFGRMGNGTRRFLGATKDTLTFKKDKLREPLSGQTKTWNRNSAKTKEKSSFFGSWFKSEEPQKPATIGEWMAQDRPGY